MSGKHKHKKFLISKNKFIRNYVDAYESASVKIVGGYIDPQLVPTNGFYYKGIKQIIVGELFLLGKIF